MSNLHLGYLVGALNQKQFIMDVEVNQCFVQQQSSDAPEISTSDLLVMGQPLYLQDHTDELDSPSLELKRKSSLWTSFLTF